MMKTGVTLGNNRTGIDLSPIDKAKLIEATEATIPSMDGDATEIAEVRSEYLEDTERVGSVPPPATVKGVAKSGLDALKGGNPTMLVDKLGERLAFERTGTRLYDALIAKFQGSEPLPGGPSLEDLRHIRAEELEHFEMVRDAILSLGGDPTTMTPAADVASVSSMGLIQVLSDPRTTLMQGLEAILIAELVDNDGWPMLINLVQSMGHPLIAQKFEKARAAEEEHLAKVRSWVQAGTLSMAGPGPVVKETVKDVVKGAVAGAAKAVGKTVAKDEARDVAKKKPH